MSTPHCPGKIIVDLVDGDEVVTAVTPHKCLPSKLQREIEAFVTLGQDEMAKDPYRKPSHVYKDMLGAQGA